MPAKKTTRRSASGKTGDKRRALKHTRATISDVAEHCGLSKATVSRILGDSAGNYSIRPATRERVQAAAQLLGYQPNRLARAIASSRTRLIGLAIPARRVRQVEGVAPVSVITSISHILLSGIFALPEFQGYDLVIHKYDQSPESAQMPVNFNEDLLDGLIFIDPGAQAKKILETMAKKMPVIALGTYDSHIRFRAIDADNRRLTCLAGEYLIRQFGGEVIYVENRNLSSLVCMKLRREGFAQALRQQALDSDENRFHRLPIENDSLPPEALEEVLAARRPRAIMASSDDVAVAVLEAARNLRLKIPEDIGLMGFGDAVISQTCRPSLSTVQLPFFDLARQAASEIIATLDRGMKYQSGMHLLSEGDLILRESTALA
ncbi:LacI family DNA-binding transcriptional regulator [Ruficoccus amylovorans]|uniref:LacI family DNA-binding transcriptional regulator n=1 Tax=Ruficoccus amylovorans TaxID=1804625 RepID=A0A842HKB6_9BACT|nr:LacI family DNA-binding transcriptional regulator [Ruficoccus amylovorans]MBC2595986.1 LacI family DNA-binding transcriptional regulator [Ruficoccus amylovorans]